VRCRYGVCGRCATARSLSGQEPVGVPCPDAAFSGGSVAAAGRDCSGGGIACDGSMPDPSGGHFHPQAPHGRIRPARLNVRDSADLFPSPASPATSAIPVSVSAGIPPGTRRRMPCRPIRSSNVRTHPGAAAKGMDPVSRLPRKADRLSYLAAPGTAPHAAWVGSGWPDGGLARPWTAPASRQGAPGCGWHSALSRRRGPASSSPAARAERRLQ
jgi:hypothetical protein